MSVRNISWGRGGKGGRCVRLTTLPPLCVDYFEILGPHSPGILWACKWIVWLCLTEGAVCLIRLPIIKILYGSCHCVYCHTEYINTFFFFLFFNRHCNPYWFWPAQLTLSILSRKVFTECHCQRHVKPQPGGPVIRTF